MTRLERAEVDQIAQVMADGAESMAAAARQLGWSRTTAAKRWQVVRAKMGAQAV